MRQTVVKVKQSVAVNGDLVYAFREWARRQMEGMPEGARRQRWQEVVWDTHKSKLDPELLGVMLMERAGFLLSDWQGSFGFELREDERPSTNHPW